MSLRYQIPTWLQRCYGGVVWRKDASSKVVYLTFDDGPVPQTTPALLDILEREGVKATFFMVGENAQRNRELKNRVVAQGHRIGNHTYNHMTGTRVSVEQYMANVAQADPWVDGSRLFRPPHGRLRWREKQALRKAGYQIVLWDVMTHDWDAAYDAERIMSIVKRYVRNGSIINFHDSVKSHNQTLSAIENVIRYLKNEGYTFGLL